MKTAQIDIAEARIYCGTYKKYNEGSIFGKWFDLSEFDSKEDFYAACAELHNDEDDPEFMFQDWENIPTGLIGESWLSDNLFNVINKFNELSDHEKEAFAAYLENDSSNIEDIEKAYSDFEEAYQGQYDSDEDFAQQMADDLGYIDKNVNWPYTCIDWEYAARELMYDYYEVNGFYFRN